MNQQAIMKPGQFLSMNKDKIFRLKARDYDEEQFLMTAMALFSENDKLRECLNWPQGQMSVYNAMKQAASTGLSLNPMEGKAALIPYKRKCTYQIMKNGYIELAMDTGRVRFITADAVREHDEFSVSKTSDGDTFIFTPQKKSRGDIIGFFAFVKLDDGTGFVSYMTNEEMDSHRERYSIGYKYSEKKDEHVWGKSYEGMGIKTVLKKLLRNMNISPAITAAVTADDKSEMGEITEEMEALQEEQGGESPNEMRARVMNNEQETDVPIVGDGGGPVPFE